MAIVMHTMLLLYPADGTTEGVLDSDALAA